MIYRSNRAIEGPAGRSFYCNPRELSLMIRSGTGPERPAGTGSIVSLEIVPLKIVPLRFVRSFSLPPWPKKNKSVTKTPE